MLVVKELLDISILRFKKIIENRKGLGFMLRLFCKFMLVLFCEITILSRLNIQIF